MMLVCPLQYVLVSLHDPTSINAAIGIVTWKDAFWANRESKYIGDVEYDDGTGGGGLGGGGLGGGEGGGGNGGGGLGGGAV
jgi:hypothetical protein